MVDSRTPLMDSHSAPNSARGQVVQQNAYLQPGYMQSQGGPNAMQGGTYLNGGEYANGEGPRTIVPPGDGATMVNAPDGNLLQSQYQNRSMYGQMSANERQQPM